MNASKIRIHAELIAQNIQSIAGITFQLRRSYDTLYNELQSADPQQDRPFERFMLHLTRSLHDLQSDHITSLSLSAAAMCDYPDGGRASREPSAAPGAGTPPSRSACPGAGTPPSRSASPGAGTPPSRSACPGAGTPPSRSATLEGERPASRPVAARASAGIIAAGVAVLVFTLLAGCSNPTYLNPETQSGRMNVTSAQTIQIASGSWRDILVLRDSQTGCEYLAVMGAGVTTMRTYFDGNVMYQVEE